MQRAVEGTDNRAGFQQAPLMLLCRAEIRAQRTLGRGCAAAGLGWQDWGSPGWTCPKPDQVIQAHLPPLEFFPLSASPRMKFLQEYYFMPVDLQLQVTAVL